MKGDTLSLVEELKYIGILFMNDVTRECEIDQWIWCAATMLQFSILVCGAEEALCVNLHPYAHLLYVHRL